MGMGVLTGIFCCLFGYFSGYDLGKLQTGERLGLCYCQNGPLLPNTSSGHTGEALVSVVCDRERQRESKY